MSCGSLSRVPNFPTSSNTTTSEDVPCGIFQRSVRFSATEPRASRRSDSSGDSVRHSMRHSTGPIAISNPLPPFECGSMSRSAPASVPVGDDNTPGSPCRFPKLEECAHFHYERVSLGGLMLTRVPEFEEEYANEMDQGWVTVKVETHVNTAASSMEESFDNSMTMCQNSKLISNDTDGWHLTRNASNFVTLDDMLHRCIYDRKISNLPNLSSLLTEELINDRSGYVSLIEDYLHHLSIIADDTINCASILNWLHADNKGHKLLVSDEDSGSINTPAVAAAYSVRKYVSQARDELSFEVGDMISVIDMPGADESMWWRGKRGFNVGFFPQNCVAVIGDKVPRNMSQPPPIVGSVAVISIKPVLRKHGKLISLFRSFILSRPSRRNLKLQGILKERVFGCDLGEHLANTQQDVPLVLKCCKELLESEEAPDGVYRLPGGATLVQRLRNAFDDVSNTCTNILDDPDVRADRHAVASLLKLYFRELPNPLCTYQLYSEFVASVRAATPLERLKRMRRTVLKLPPPHYRTLRYLMRHLKTMSNESDRTGMSCRNLAIVWAPNLLRTPNLTRAPSERVDLSGLALQAVVTEYLITYADEVFDENCEVDIMEEEVAGLEDQDVTLRSSSRRPKTLTLSRSPTKLLSLEEARNRNIKAASISANLLPPSTELNNRINPKYIEVGSGPNNLPQYHTVIELPSGGGQKRTNLKRSPSVWRTFFTRGSHKEINVKKRPSIQLLINSDCVDDKRQDVGLMQKETILRPVKSCESLGSENDSLPALPQASNIVNIKQHSRSASCDSYFEPWQVDLAGMRLRLSPQELDGNIFSEEDDTNKLCVSSSTTPDGWDPLKSVELSPSRPDSSLRKRCKLEEQLQFIDADTPKHTPAQHIDAKRVCRDAQTNTNSNECSPTHVKLRERASPRKAKTARYSNMHLLQSESKNPTTKNLERKSWHADNHSTLIKIHWPSDSESVSDTPKLESTPERVRKLLTTDLDLIEEKAISDPISNDNKVEISTNDNSELSDVKLSYEILESSDLSDFKTDSKNMQLSVDMKSSLTSHGSSTMSNISPMKNCDDLYECVNFSRPSYINLSNCTSKSSLSSPLKSPLRSTISITFKSPTKVSKIGDDYENLDLSLRNEYENELFTDENKVENDADDIYSQVKLLRKSVDEVNAMISENESDIPHYENVGFSKLSEPKLCIDRRVLEDNKKDNVLKTLNSNVKQLATRFESPTESNFSYEKFKYSTLDRKKSVDKKTQDNPNDAPKSLNSIDISKLSTSTRSLDENAFSKEFETKSKHKIIDAKTKNIDKEKITPTNENKISLVQARLIDTEPKSLVCIIDDKKLSRERIEKYKEERRNFLREKYSSQSFRQNESKLSRISDKEAVKVTDEVVELRQKSDDTVFERRNTFDLGQRMKFRKLYDDINEKTRNSMPSTSCMESDEKHSPASVNIKDMAAIFEQRAQNLPT